VRPARPRDLDRIGALWTAVAAHHAAVDASLALRPGAERALRDLLAAELRDPSAALFVFESGTDGDLAGFCCVRIEPTSPLAAEAQRAEITDLGVRAGARRQGIGSALVAEALAWLAARGVARVEVRVASGNREGQAFWRAHGFADLVDVLQRRL
jgi:ribosomal protein S18 acetylase RimI-like enzyme